MAHDLGSVAAPDVVGEVEGEELLRAAGGISQHAGQQGGGVGGEDGFLGQQGLELLIEGGLGLGVLGQRLDDEVSVVDGGGQIGGVAQLLIGLLRPGQQFAVVDGGGVGGVEHKAAAHGRAGVGLGGGQLGDINGVEPVHLGTGALNGGLAAEINSGVESGVGGLIGDLAAQHAAAHDNDIFDRHMVEPPVHLLVC